MVAKLVVLWDGPPVAFLLLLAACLFFFWTAARLAVVDIRQHRLPNRILFPAYPIAGLLLLAVAWLESSQAGPGEPQAALFDVAGLRVLAGGAVLYAAYYLLRVLQPSGLGFGDVKLAGFLGLYLGFLGWEHLVVATVAAFLLGGLMGIGILVTKRGTLKTAIAFGPFMLSGAVIAFFLPG